MPIQDLALPVDIPWKRLVASRDMVDPSFGDSRFPPRWRSSIAVFYHEPDEPLPEGYCDRRITYLKVCCSITGYQLDQKEVGFEFEPDGRALTAVPIIIRARGTPAQGEWPSMALRVNGQEVKRWDVQTPKQMFKLFVADADLVRGQNTVEVAFLNDLWTEGGDRNLFIDGVTVGPRVLSPLDPGVTYNQRDSNGVVSSSQGQREMWSEGELVFTVDYRPQDWMTQLVQEYDSIGAYLPCYGALLHVGVYPSAQQKREVTRVRVRFAQRAASNTLANPYEVEGVRFRAQGVQHNVVSDLPGIGRVLSLQQLLTVTFPRSSRVEARLYAGIEVTAEVFSGETRIDSRVLRGAAEQAQTVVLEGDDIDRVEFRAPQDEAWLAELAYDAVRVLDLQRDDYPYVMDFEPKKRELYEAVTETGEMLSRSATTLNIRKGVTDTNSLEDVDIFQGAQGGLKIGEVLEVSGGVRGEWGSRTTRAAEHVNLRTTDDSREKRETFSHSTTLSQLYHLFSGYHLGTNRSLFFMLPRPHVTEVVEDGRVARTFVKGPRRLEGVQEVFLVVNRPRSVPGICVEALLETAHLNWETDVTIQESQAEQPTLPTHHELELYLTEKYREKAIPYYHDTDKELYHVIIIRYYWDEATGRFLTEGVRQEDTDVKTRPGLESKSYEDALAEYLRDNPPPAAPPPEPVRTVTTRSDLIVTARSAKGCLPDSGHGGCVERSLPEALSGDGHREWVALEGEIELNPALTRVDAPLTVKARAANELTTAIGRRLRASLGSRERYPRGAVGLLQSRFALGRLQRRLAMMPDDDPHNRPVIELEQIDHRLRARFRRAFPKVRTRKEALRLPLHLLRLRLDLSEVEARDLQLRLMGIAAPGPLDKSGNDQSLA